MKTRFGTDGVRGRFGDEVNATLAWWVGYGAGRQLGGPIAVGRDTRPSGAALAAAAIAGVRAAGAGAVDYGVVPTPALAWAVRDHARAGGIMITASHNLAEDNGLKVLGAGGEKADEALRSAIEATLARSRTPPELGSRGTVEAGSVDGWAPLAGLDLTDQHVVFDAANGAGHHLGAALLRGAGARVTVVGDGYGRRINLECGATHPLTLEAAVLAAAGLPRSPGATVGIALDGDGDRLAMVIGSARPQDPQGQRILDGDAMLWVLAHDLPPGATVVGTIMSNLALERGLVALGLRFERSAVGDSEVWERMIQTGATMGGEPSGHIMFCGAAAPVGSCGLSTAARVLAIPAPKRLERLLNWHPAIQQHGVVRVSEAVGVVVGPGGPSASGALKAAVAELVGPLSRELTNRGARVVVRPSGTEPIIRAMVEHADADVAEGGLQQLIHLLCGIRP